MTGKREVRKVDTDEIEGEYILKNTDPGKKKIIFSTVIWYDPETKKYYFKSESDMNGNRLAGQVVSHKLMQDLLSISKWMLKPLGELWDDPSRVHSGGIDTEKMAVDWKLGWKPKKQNGKPLKRNKRFWGDKPSTTQFRRTDSSINHDGPKYAGAPYNRERDEDDIRRALKRQDDQKKEKPKTSWLKGTPAQRAEHAKKLDTIKREGYCPKCHRRFTPEDESACAGKSEYLCKWCWRKYLTNCKEDEYSDFTKEDSK